MTRQALWAHKKVCLKRPTEEVKTEPIVDEKEILTTTSKDTSKASIVDDEPEEDFEEEYNFPSNDGYYASLAIALFILTAIIGLTLYFKEQIIAFFNSFFKKPPVYKLSDYLEGLEG